MRNIKNNKHAIFEVILGILVAVLLIAIIGALIFLGLFLLLGIWTLIGLGLIFLAIIIACTVKRVLIWVPILLIGIILVFVEYIQLV